MIVRSAEYLTDNTVPPQMLNSVVQEQRRELERLRKLREYYEGKNAIMDRRRVNGLPNTRVSHGYARYIATMASGYLIGSPVRYASADDAETLNRVVSEYRRGMVDSVDAEIARYCSIYGKGCEIVFSNGKSAPRSCAVSPEEAFVVYGETAAREALFGVHYYPALNAVGVADGWKVEVYTPTHLFQYKVAQLQQLNEASPDITAWHFFGRVPVIEYWNGEDERGDFEDVIPLIDAYDALQSDRVNDKEQFVDALLVLIGARIDEDERGRSPAKQLREDKAVSLPEGCDVKWLYKNLSEADTDVLRASLNADIHKMSMIPDLTDQNFSQNASGVAMKYKLLGFEQLIKIKERWFREGLRERLRLYARFLGVRGVKTPDADTVEIAFSRGLPVNEEEQAQVIAVLREAGAITAAEAVSRIHPEWTKEQCEKGQG